MYRIVLVICVLLCPLLSVYAVEDGTIGERLELGFYSRIHAGMDTTADTLRKKDLSEYKTFRSFGRNCRPSIAWLDREPMNEQILQQATRGDTSLLVELMAKNNTFPSSNTDSMSNLVSCLRETYQKMGDRAVRSEESLSSAGMLGLYSDGNTENSDYDITADIERLNSILFTEKLGYLGSTNIARDSYTALAEGADIAPSLADTSSTTTHALDTPELGELGIGATCGPSSVTPVTNISEEFRGELAAVLGGGTPPLGGEGYGTVGSRVAEPLSTEKDFFHTPPCSATFCIKVKTVPTTVNLLGGGKTYSIESLLDKHSKIMQPIAGSNLSGQKMTRNSFKFPFLNIILKDKVAGGKIYIEDSPQRTKRYEKEYTQEEQDKEFDALRRCAYVYAGLPSDPARANITGGVGYQIWTTSNADSIDRTNKDLSISNPEDVALKDCMPIALGQSRAVYYNSVATDLTELEVFTSSLVNMLENALTEHKALDKKQIR